MTKEQKIKRLAQKKLTVISDVEEVASGAETYIYVALKTIAEACLFILEKK